MREQPLWVPSPGRVARTNLMRFAASAGGTAVPMPGAGEPRVDFAALHRWSVDSPAEFWSAVWRFCGVVAASNDSGGQWDQVVHGWERMAPPDPALGPTWFPGARLNFAENLLRWRDDREALVSWGEEGRRTALTYAALYEHVAALTGAFRGMGIRSGDRVAGYMPNVPETVVAMLATASIGAIWSSCSVDFGVQGVVDRFGQIAPRLLIAADGYRYAGKELDLRDRLAEIAAQIPEVERVVVVPVLKDHPEVGSLPRAVLWSDFVSEAGSARGAPPETENTTAPSPPRHATIDFTRLPFDHPLYILYSSGTTGLPKCMVHGAGGTLLQHLKELVLHTDLSRDDRIFYFTTCGWMMWNWLVSALAVGATVVLYDGAPMAPATRQGMGQPAPGHDLLWQMAEEERLTVFGTSARYLALAEKEGIRPGGSRDLTALRAVLSTGSPLAPASFDYVYRDIKADVQLSSISGGTDIVSCFALGNPTGPVWRGEIQVPGLGMAVAIFDDEGRPLGPGRQGELVCMRPFPSMPVSFWNDPEASRYRAAYFDRWPGVWRHGDWAEFTPHGGVIITGRSDATLNPGGVRIGTAEIYRQVEQLEEVLESLVVGQETGGERERDVRTILFVRLREGLVLDDTLRERIRRRVREHASPHHVPRVIIQVADIPRTISGKITELAVRDVIHNRPVRNTEALANPAALELFRNLPELRDSARPA
jgi:acetoacetyl-CoA synthetase